MRIHHIHHQTFTELTQVPPPLPADGSWLWVSVSRQEIENDLPSVQKICETIGGTALLDLHVSDFVNTHLPSNFDYTPWYDVLVFRRLSKAVDEVGECPVPLPAQQGIKGGQGGQAHLGSLEVIDTNPIGFAIFDRLLLTVHPNECSVMTYFVQRLTQQSQPEVEVQEARTMTVRLPSSPAELMLRMVNHMVDSFLDLRRILTRDFSLLQEQLLNAKSRFHQWPGLIQARNTLQLLEDTCNDQHDAIQEWIDSLNDWPATDDAAVRRERELLRLRSRDVHEHIERVVTHIHRLEQSIETAVQMHFSTLSNRTNDIMRTLTVLTAIFLPLNLITGIFGMNFDALPLIHSPTGAWIAFGLMLMIGVVLFFYFRSKRFLGRSS